MARAFRILPDYKRLPSSPPRHRLSPPLFRTRRVSILWPRLFESTLSILTTSLRATRVDLFFFSSFRFFPAVFCFSVLFLFCFSSFSFISFFSFFVIWLQSDTAYSEAVERRLEIFSPLSFGSSFVDRTTVAHFRFHCYFCVWFFSPAFNPQAWKKGNVYGGSNHCYLPRLVAKDYEFPFLMD